MSIIDKFTSYTLKYHICLKIHWNDRYSTAVFLKLFHAPTQILSSKISATHRGVTRLLIMGGRQGGKNFLEGGIICIIILYKITQRKTVTAIQWRRSSLMGDSRGGCWVPVKYSRFEGGCWRVGNRFEIEGRCWRMLKEGRTRGSWIHIRRAECGVLKGG